MGGVGSGAEGIYSLAAKDVFALNAQRGDDRLSVSVSFFEIYGGKVCFVCVCVRACVLVCVSRLSGSILHCNGW